MGDAIVKCWLELSMEEFQIGMQISGISWNLSLGIAEITLIGRKKFMGF